MRTRDVYATLLELVPPLVEDRAHLRASWSDRADPVWRRGEDWVRVEVITTQELLLTAGRGDETLVTRTQKLTGEIEPIARDIAGLLNGAGVSS